MTPTPDDDPDLLPDYTPEQKAAIYAEMDKRFPPDELPGADEGEPVPLDDVIARMEAIAGHPPAPSAGE